MVDRVSFTSVWEQTKAAGRRTGGDTAAIIIDLSSDHDSGVENKAAAMHLGADAEHPIIIDTDDGDRARPRGQEQSSMEKSDVAWPVSSSRSVQPVEDIVHRTPAGANTFVNQPEAGPSQPRYGRGLKLCVAIEFP